MSGRPKPSPLAGSRPKFRLPLPSPVEPDVFWRAGRAAGCSWLLLAAAWAWASFGYSSVVLCLFGMGGRAAWTELECASLHPHTHTKSFQGSLKPPIVIGVPEHLLSAEAAAIACEVAPALADINVPCMPCVSSLENAFGVVSDAPAYHT